MELREEVSTGPESRQGEGSSLWCPQSIQATAAPLPVQALGCIFYACFIVGRLCVPVFTNMSQEPFSTRALVLSIMHATLPGPCGQGWLGRVVFEDPLFPLHPYSVPSSSLHLSLLVPPSCPLPLLLIVWVLSLLSPGPSS